ncbi:alpha,alpha-trehalase [Natranaeroarchaeum sulfidigenes]|uniref:alpha,alpha-trehalase n=1 Tax=Natranaeroarchaeum sulfidigenes TaxID=2784880 RepID=UPI001EE58E08|nr:alpha,alpha-trehalase [Natranaeroarchaeum sulfidigenes]
MTTSPPLRGPLFEAVQRSDIFEDSKTFVDSVPRMDPDRIHERFQERRHDPAFDLRSFVYEHFEVPNASEDTEYDSEQTAESMAAHIRALWPRLVDHPDDEQAIEYGSLIGTPEPYITPGGRFRELYYWDSYFTAEGLAASDRFEDVENIVENFAWAVEEFGYVPNATREYQTTRTQPPLFAETVKILERERGTEAVVPYLDALDAEYEYWMSGREELAGAGTATRRVVDLGDAVLNRYWDESSGPRRESYDEDVELAERVPDRDRETLYRDIRAAAESGWDFSSRWCRDESMETIRTTELVPVDLNALLYGVERDLAGWHAHLGNDAASEAYVTAAQRRAEAIDQYCWDDEAGFYFDYSFVEGDRTTKWTLAATVPLYTGLASDEQAAAVADHLRDQFLSRGGLVTTLTESGEQWDAPNGWAPLHWFAVLGLERSGHDELAREIATRWVDHARTVYERTGRMVEKYDVTADGRLGGGGEYELQDGFGWTNGVTIAFQERYGLFEQH